ncbi:MAG: cytochrome P450 [Actinomycetota bacterium]|nr:cytochrome P450 [Actinomycetota bacterium]
MTATVNDEIYYDPYDPVLQLDPYPVFRRMREEAPLYYNEQHNFFALSRFDDVETAFKDHETFSSSRGNILELVHANVEMPSGVFIFEDPPLHTAHRGVLSRVFTPKKMNVLEPQIRAYCARVLDPLIGTDRLDFVADLGAKMPMKVIGMLLGVPEADQEELRVHQDNKLRRKEGEPGTFTDKGLAESTIDGTFFEEYVTWRTENPSDDLMTQLIQAEFEDETGTVRRLTREEILIFVNILATAGNETTNRVIGWSGKILADNPDQRRDLVEDRSLIPNAVEEILRCQPPALQACRYVTRDVELHGQVVPAGSVMMLLMASANRDSEKFPPDGDQYDIRRQIGHHLTFGYGLHFCLGAALARLEARIAIDEILQRFPEWEVDMDNAKLDSSQVRGWQTLPVHLPTN